MKREKRKNGEALMCDCCTMPYGYLQNGKLVISSRHGSQQHTNALTPEQLRRLADELEAEKGLRLVKTA